MNLFEIQGKITLDSGGALGAINAVTGAAKSAAGALGSLAGTALKIGGTVAAGVATAGGAIVKSAVTSYAEAEQLIGGINTLFGDSASTVQAYAANAYQTAGLSANQYMDTVMGFSASLRQSLNGDTDAMAEYANMAVTDMADNANKMGTDMGMIQNAYQGFAKQNYTMLDNLKLGYGGTKGEMQRLIKDANAVKKANGEMADLSINSLADVVEAIHIVQTEMGITGTTALEAEKTITGSTASMKAAWSNLMTGVADENADMDKLVDNFVDAGVTAAENVVPRVATAIRGTMQLGQTLVPAILDQFETYKPQLQDGFYSLVTDGLNFAGIDVEQTDVQGTFESIFGGVGEVGKTLQTELGGIKDTFVSNLGEIGKTLGENGVSIEGFFSGLSETLSTVSEPIEAGIDTAMKGITKLTDWATTDGSTLNGILTGTGEGLKGFAGGLTDLIEAAGFLFEGDTEGAGKEIESAIEKTSIGFGRAVGEAGAPLGNLYGRIGQWIGQSLFGEDFDFGAKEMSGADVLSLFGVPEDVINTVFPAEAMQPEIKPYIDEATMLEIEAQGDAAAAGWVSSYSENPIQPDIDVSGAESAQAELDGVASAAAALDSTSASATVEAQGAEAAAAEIEAATSATEAADGATATTEVEAQGAEAAASAIEAVASAAEAAGSTNVNVTVDASSATQAQAQVQQSAQAMQAAMEFSLSVPTVDTSSFNAAVSAASAAASAIQAAFASISISIPAPSVGGGGAGGSGVSATSAGGGTPAVAAVSVGSEYYASGAVLTHPTVFGFNPYTGNRMIGGEAGPEAVAPIATLQSYVGEAVAEQNAEQAATMDRQISLMEMLVDALPTMMRDAMEGMAFKTNSREFGRLVKEAKA